jgi:class 3 adenylate cyclase
MNTEQQKSSLAILFADISGSTALYDKLGNERALKLVSGTLDILILEMAKHQGTLIKTIGDEIMCTFPGAVDAVNAAQAMHQKMEEQNPANGQPVYVRIGIHYGEVIQGAGDVFGDAVNVAARVTSISRARQITTTQSVVDMLPEDMRKKARPVMRAEFRGKQNALSIFLIIWEKDDTMSTRIGMSAYRKPAEAQTKSQLFLRYRQQVLTLNEQSRSALLGRDNTCDLVIQNKLASRQHALVEYSFGKFLITDHSANGTFIRFSDNQVIQLSHQQIVLHGAGQISFGQSFAESPVDVVEYILQ